jgi:hypothetical protein
VMSPRFHQTFSVSEIIAPVSKNVVNHRLQAASTGAEERVYRFYSMARIVETCYREYRSRAVP